MGKSAAADVLAAIEEKAKHEYLPIIGPAQGAELERLVRERDPRLAVDIGVMTGYSLVRIGRSLSEGGRAVGIEISQELARRAEENVAAAGLAGRCDVVRGDAREAIDTIKGEIDLAFLDAERGQYLNYLLKLEPKLAPGAFVIASGVGVVSDRLQKYFDHVRLSGRYESSYLALDDDGMEISRFRG